MARPVGAHGTRGRYVSRKCRCGPCRAENARYQQARRAGLTPENARHGTITGYRDHGCRCPGCRAAKSSGRAA